MPCRGTHCDFAEHYGVPAHMPGTDPFTDSYAKPHFQPRLPLRPTHLTLDLHFDIASRTVHGTATHRVTAQMSGAATLRLHAEDFMSVSVTAASDAGLTYSYDGHEVDIMLSKPLEKGTTADIAVAYRVENPIDGLLFSRAGDGFFVVSDHETERARYWLPVVDHPTVRTTVSFRLSTPASDTLTVLANGQLVGEATEGGVRVTKWEMRQPTPSYLVCVAIGDFLRVDDGEHDGKPVAYFAPNGARVAYTPEHLRLTFGRTRDMLVYMERKTGVKLPWPKYFQWAVGEVSGAMENSSLVSYDEWYLQDARDTGERSHRVDSTVVHELAHTWFGNAVGCADFCHSFLKESFATLISAEWYGARNGPDDAQYTLAMYAESAFAETSEYMRPIVTRRYETSWALFDRHLYTNGASRLNMLRHRLGDERFWAAVSHYLQKRLWTAVETDDFRRDLEEATGEELASFFEQWFYSKGHPVLDVSFSYDMSKALAFVSVKQSQADDKRGIATFDLPVELELETAPGKFETHVLHMTAGAPSAQLALALPARPLQVVLDPGKKSLFALGRCSGLGDDLWLRALTDGRTFFARYQAAKQLHSSGSQRARAALRAALAAEKHWGLRVELAHLVGKGGRAEDVTALQSRLDAESDARTRAAVAEALGETRHPAGGRALLAFVRAAEGSAGDGQRAPDEGSDSGSGGGSAVGYVVLGNALRGLGRWGGLGERTDAERAEVGALLVRHLETYGASTEDGGAARGAQVALGAAGGVGLLRDWGSAERAMELAAGRGAEAGRRSNRVRAALVRAVGQAATWEGRTRRMEAFAFAESVLRDEESGKSLRMAAAATLAGLADVGRVGDALDNLERRVENQAKPDVRALKRRARRVASARDGGAAKVGGAAVDRLQAEVSELKVKMAELQSKLDSVAGKESREANKKDSEANTAVDGE